MIKLAALILVTVISAGPLTCGGGSNGQPDGPVKITAPVPAAK